MPESSNVNRGPIFAAETVRMSWWGHLIFAVAGAWVVMNSINSDSLWWMLLLLFLWASFTQLSLQVTSDYFQVRLGLIRVRIPISRIISVQSVPSSSFFKTGWGIRFGFDGAITYSVASSISTYVLVEYKKRSGKLKTLRVMSKHPDVILRAIQKAQAPTW